MQAQGFYYPLAGWATKGYSCPNMHANPSYHPVRTITRLVVLSALILAALNYQLILDQYALATFRPAPAMQQIEARLMLTGRARASFYRAQPQLDEKAAFNRDCETQPHELELGCYFHGRIYVLHIDNPSLVPEMDVVAAHELLHAVWAHASRGQREKLTVELERVYKLVADEDLRQRMAGYAKSEPGEEANELHSILGTEFANLSPMLEEHYAHYFTKRAAIVAAHAIYQRVFDSRRVELETELSEIRSKKGQLGTLNRQMEAFRTSGQIAQYNALVPRQNQLVDDINKRIEIYRQGVEEYNALSKSLDSQQITDTEAPAQ